MRIKNWGEFQHFKDRNPPWIKVHKSLLDDPDWHELSDKAAKVLVMLWLVASEDRDKDGKLPCLKKLAFRLRIKEESLSKTLQELSHWLYQDDIKMISSRYQVDVPETETETETEEETETEKSSVYQVPFSSFWKIYPKKKNQSQAERAWKKLQVDEELFAKITKALAWQVNSKDWKKENGQYIPYPSTYLNQKRWEDEPEVTSSGADDIMRGVI